MSYVEVPGAKVPIRMWAEPAGVEDVAMRQLQNVATLPWIKGLAVMPDVHYGKGATVGSVIAMKDAVCPAAVGVDIGCGMSAVRTSLTANDLPGDLSRLRSRIEQAIPVGRGMHAEPVDADGVYGFGDSASPARLRDFWDRFELVADAVKFRRERALQQMGTLGSGNHFVEVCLDDEGAVWLMLHSGSRNIGKELADHHIGAAQQLAHNQGLVDRDLAVFLAGTPEMAAYRNDLFWAQEYARYNRAVMMGLLQEVLRGEFRRATVGFDPVISCHHNYVAEETYDGVELLVTRKGAIRAGAGDLGIIPGSMGTGSYIVRGLGNEKSFNSASHGAGRRMSRNQAKKRFSERDLAEQTRGVECRKDSGVVDEIPAAYKPIEQVIERQTDLVQVVAKLKQVVCVKG
ncbi:RtcB family protein [Streptomyces sp. NPDC017979]|uniref:RtcB family protein n=1 Tax=unclassified Streptomyces TaxID=2593676 RepID=UPI0033C324B6